MQSLNVRGIMPLYDKAEESQDFFFICTKCFTYSICACVSMEFVQIRKKVM